MAFSERQIANMRASEERNRQDAERRRRTAEFDRANRAAAEARRATPEGKAADEALGRAIRASLARGHE
jgi:hypothetical protein